MKNNLSFEKAIKLLIIFSILTLFIYIRIFQLEQYSIVKNYSPKSISHNLIYITTKWGELLDKNRILPEYPRPQFVRYSYLNLNGPWKYSLINENEIPIFDEEIIVPFSIESPLSGVSNKTLKPGKELWYKRTVDLTKLDNKGRFILHFGAVDQYTKVYINDKKVGEHDGGYTSFYFDITEYLEDLSKTKITVKVTDNYDKDGAAIGKQGDPRGKIFYVRTGGIWQTVWIESVPNVYIRKIQIEPDYDNHSVSFLMKIDGKIKEAIIGNVIIFDSEKNFIINSSNISPNERKTITLPEKFRSWSPEDPYLYKVEFSFDEDHVNSYFGMRKFSIGKDKNKMKRLFLNNKPYFQKGVLDQGYWSDGYYTAPSDEAIIYDIQTMKDLGFNMIRKHLKVEPLRWYYHCDTIGMIVWQDQPSGGEFPYKSHRLDIITIHDHHYEKYKRESEIGRNNFIRDLTLTIKQLYNAPCISTWVPFNEAWGQFDSIKISNLIKELDKTRFVDHASGWVDHGGPDFQSIHIYKESIHFHPDKYNRPIVLSEYGGLGNIIENHVGAQYQFSYRMYPTKYTLSHAIRNLIKKEIFPNIKRGLSASVYTQLSDVEEEVNGFLTYDRKILKVDKYLIKKANDLLKIKN